MSRTRSSRFTALLLALVVLTTLTSVATAQIDDRARELLEGMVGAAADLDLDTLDQTMVMTIPQADGEITTRTRMAIDYENRRAASITELGDGMTTRMVHQDGNTVMHMPGMDMAMPVPPQMAGIFESVFDTPVQNLLDQEGATATYDGRVSYGDLIEGQQVTYTGSFDVMGVTESSETKFLFDDAGAPIGVVTAVDGDVIVMVYDTPFDPASPLPTRDMTMYSFDGSVGTLYATLRYEDVRVNEPLDESLFE